MGSRVAKMWGRPGRITRRIGFDVKVDASWPLIAILVLWSLATGYFPARLPDETPGTYVVLAFAGLAGLIASILLHELAHAIVARAYGVQISRMTLYLFGGLADMKGALPTPFVEIWIASAGPVSTLFLAFLFWLGGRLAEFAGTSDYVVAALSYLAFVNLILGLGNLIPAFPLDGGRILRAIYWIRSGDLVGATLRATRLSVVLSILLIAVGLIAVFSGDLAGGLWPAVIGLLLVGTARQSRSNAPLAAAPDGRTVADLMTRDPCTVQPDQPLSELVSQVFLDQGISFAPVVENGVVLGYVDTQLVLRIDRENWATTVVDDVIESISDENSVPPDLPGRDLLDRIGRTGRRKFMVVAGTALVGVVTLSDLITYLRVAEDLQ
jgi:Zn-dependent protease/predicted transcriptional regulator